MQEILSVISDILYKSFIIFFIIMFYLSIKKCFWRGKKSKAKLFVMTLLTNPFLMFFGLIFILFIVMIILLLFSSLDSIVAIGPVEFAQKMTNSKPTSQYTSTLGMCLFIGICWFFYLLFLFIIANFIGKWLDAPNKSLVTFIYIMFSIVMTCTLTIHNNIDNNPLLQTIINIIDTLIQYIAIIVMYFFNIKALSKMTSERREINWKLFVIPPSFFSLVRIVLFSIQVLDNNIYVTITFYVFSDILIFLFIWAFYVIIQNINATNDAIKAKNEVKTLSVEVMEALAHTIDAKDEYTRGHSVRVAKYSRMIAQRLNLSSEECENVYYMALLHDIGKIGVPNEIINSTTKLTDEEYTVIKTHPVVGYDILAEIKSRPDLSIGARWHHERYDGKGYPDGKKGEEIPFFARIIAVADSYDAMTSNRSYRKYMPQDKVRFEIENNIGSQFDPDVAKCMLSIIDEDVDYELHE